MTKRPETFALFAAVMLCAHTAPAQPNLPPPPPPPIDQAPEAPPLPPPQRQAPPSETSASPPARHATPPPPPPYRTSTRVRRTEEITYYVEAPPAHPVAVTLNPVGLFAGRLSANVELQLVPHHSLVLSPNLLVFHADRGTMMSDGFGFASSTSNGIGIELGYHYWWRWALSLSGPYMGPSVLLGSTSEATVGDPTHAQSYWGLAFDVGWQEVLSGGFTVGIGAGLGLVRMSGNGTVFPRILAQVGWSF